MINMKKEVNSSLNKTFKIIFANSLIIGGISVIITVITKITIFYFIVSISAIIAGVFSNSFFPKSTFRLIFSVFLILGGIAEIIFLITDHIMFTYIVATSAIIGGISTIGVSLIQYKTR
jgi:uncharacterized membrane protein HdeD (DUF308 family)